MAQNAFVKYFTLFLSLSFVWVSFASASDAMAESGDALVIQKSPLGKIPADPSQVGLELSPAHAVKVLEKRQLGEKGSWARVESTCVVQQPKYEVKSCSGWLPEAALSMMSEFLPIQRWKGPSAVALDIGDWSGNYLFQKNGHFKIKHQGGTEENWKAGSTTGRIFQNKNVIWAKEGSDGGQFFILVSPQKLCWLQDPSVCSD